MLGEARIIEKFGSGSICTWTNSIACNDSIYSLLFENPAHISFYSVAQHIHMKTIDLIDLPECRSPSVKAFVQAYSFDQKYYIVGYDRHLLLYRVHFRQNTLNLTKLRVFQTNRPIHVVQVAWNEQTQEIQVISGHSNGVQIRSFRPDSDQPPECLSLLQSYPIATIGLSPSAQYLAIGAMDNHIGIWDLHAATSRELPVWNNVITRHHRITCIAFSSDTSHVGFAVQNGNVLVYVGLCEKWHLLRDFQMPISPLEDVAEEKVSCGTFIDWSLDAKLLLVMGHVPFTIDAIDILSSSIMYRFKLPSVGFGVGFCRLSTQALLYHTSDRKLMQLRFSYLENQATREKSVL